VTTGSELEEIEPPDIDEFNTRDVTESLDNALVFVVDDEWTTALTVPTVPHLANASTEFTRVGNFDDIGISFEGLEKSDSFSGFGERFCVGGNDQRHFLDFFDAVAASEN
jgi:hypothetical protein